MGKVDIGLKILGDLLVKDDLVLLLGVESANLKTQLGALFEL